MQLVGQRWARLPQEEKQRYVDLAARVRKQMNGDGAGAGNGGGGGHRWAGLGIPGLGLGHGWCLLRHVLMESLPSHAYCTFLGTLGMVA